jgi:hypothetical protein
MKRRQFIAGLGSAVAWSLAARAQPGERMRRVRPGRQAHPTGPQGAIDTQEAETAARVLGVRLVVQNASTQHEIEAAFPRFVEQGVRALLVGGDQFLFHQRDQLAEIGRPPPSARNLCAPRTCRGRRSHELRREHFRCLPHCWHVHRAHPQGREAGRFVRATVHAHRNGPQPKGREGTWAQYSLDPPS